MSTKKSVSRRLMSLVLAILMVCSLFTVALSANAANVQIAEVGAVPTTIYFKSNSNWNTASAWFSMWTWSDSVSGTFTKLTDSDGDGVYEAAVPAGVDKVIFVRNNPANTALSWDSKWNQTGTQTIPTDGNNLFTMTSGSWDSGSWSTYTPPTPPKAGEDSSIYLRGTLTDWSTGAVMVYTEDTNVVSVEKELAAGDYELKIYNSSSGTWGGNSGSFTDTCTGWVMDNSANLKMTATGGTYTFEYSITANALTVTKAEEPTTTAVPVTTTAAPVTTTAVPVTTTAAPVTTTAATVETDPIETTTAATVETDPVETTTASTVETDATETTTAAPVFDGFYWESSDGLYAYAGTVADGEIPNDDAWQRWDAPNSNSYRYFYLPPSASDTEVIIYNTFSNAVTVNGVMIPAGEYKTVPYTNGNVLSVTGAESKASGVKVLKSDAEGAIFINSSETMTLTDENGNAGSGSLYSFITGGSKNREAGKLGGAVADAGGVSSASVKKIKGRGNSTWNLAKKPFNITHDSNITIDGMKGKKWSLLANAQDASLLRNRIVYDMANEVGMKYACDSRFVDWFVDGDYKGSYQLTQKIELGKNTVMPDLEEPIVEPEVDDVTGETINPPTENFDFILELDTAANASSSNDLYFTTSRGQVMTFKTPDAPTSEQQTFIKAKYQAVENALYGNDLATLETLVDLNDFAKAYLINEVAKNLDAGVTSTYFTYDSDAGKFYLSPVWDYDNAIGNSVSIEGRHDVNGNMLDLTKPSGWYVRDLAHYDLGTLNVFGQACAMTTKTSDGNTFWDIVEEVWKADFVGVIDVLEGAESTNGRLDSVAGYMSNLTHSGQWNYDYGGWTLSANNGWISDHSSLTMYDFDFETYSLTSTTKSYDQYTLVGQANYAGDWTISRLNWLANEFAQADVPTKTVYVGLVQWIDTSKTDTLHYWNDAGLSGDATLTATGESADFYAGDGYWSDNQLFYIYTAEVPVTAASAKTFLASGNTNWANEDITLADDTIILAFEYGGSYHNTTASYTAPTEPTEATTTAPTEATTAAPTETTTAVPTEPVGTKTVYFENNWMWTDISAYYWIGADVPVAWPGTALTEIVSTTDAGYDVYKFEVPANATGLIFNGTKDNGTDSDKTPDITEIVDGTVYYMVWDSEANANGYGTYIYVAPTEPTETTTVVPTEATTVAPTEATTVAPTEATATEATEPVFTPVDTEWALMGTLTDWDSGKKFQTTTEENIISLKLGLEAGSYKFKLKTGSTWYGNSGTIADTTGDNWWTMSSTAGDCTLTATNAGTFTFNFNTSTKKLQVLYSEEITTEPPVVVTSEERTVYFTNNQNWEIVNIHFWNSDDSTNTDVNTTWPGVEMTYVETNSYGQKIYSYVVPANVEGIIFNGRTATNSGNALQTVNILADAIIDGTLYYPDTQDSSSKWNVATVTYEPTDPSTGDETTVPVEEPTTVYLKLNTAWAEGTDVAYAAYVWSDASGNKWIALDETETTGIYTASIPAVYDKLIFVEYDATQTMGWSAKIAQTENLTVPVDENNMFVLVEDSTTGVWMPYSTDVTNPTLPPEVDTTVYFTNNKGWTSVNVYYWPETSAEGAFPGTAMTYVGKNEMGQEIWSFVVPAGTDGLVFNGFEAGSADFSDKSLQTVDVTADRIVENAGFYPDTQVTTDGDTDYGKWTLGDYVYDENTITTPDETESTEPYVPVAGEDSKTFIRGDFTDWTTGAVMTYTEDTNVVTYTQRIEAGTYGFKVYDNGAWLSNAGDITDTCDAWTFKNDSSLGDVDFIATGGEYTFTFDLTTKKLTITAVLDPVVYTATWDEADTYTVVAEGTEIVEGDSFTFIVTAAEGYKIDAVICGDTILKAVDGVYTIENVTSDIKLLIVANEKEEVIVPVTYYTVIFVNADGKFLSAQVVEEGQDAQAPEEPTMDATAQYTYTFTNWDVDFTNVQSNLTVTAVYSAVVNEYTVTFVGKDGATIKTEDVAYGSAATAPDAPAVDGYEFTNWDVAFDCITEDTTVTAQYKKVVTPPVTPTTGKLSIEVVGGTSFTIAINGGNARPQGASYKNTKLPIGATVTVTAVESGNTFIGWLNEGGTIVSTDLSYTFISSGNDYLKAQFSVAIEGVNTVTFKNDKANGGRGFIVDMQYYAAGDEIIFPDGPSQAGYDFAGWNMTAEQIQAELAAGNDVVVLATWTVRQVYYNVVVNGGTISDGTTEGEFLANRAVTVIAGAAPEGQKFAYWVDQNGKIKSYKAEYKFFVSYDIELTAVYVDEAEEIEYKVLAEITGDNTVAGNYINWTYSWYVPETEAGFDHVQSGILLIEDTYYNADTFYYGSGAANMVQYAPGTSAQLPENTWNTSKKDSFVGTTWHAVCWVRYIDAEGNAQIVYSDEVIVTKY
ncbi:MAG: CotH kinase family protein [Ruminococcus sp.]